MTADLFGIVGTKQAGVFRVERVVAEGGFAVVYRAMHEGFRSPVALKCLKVPEAMTDEQRAAFLERFREEGELLFRLSALVPAVVRPLHVDVLTLDGGRVVPFLALEWLDGEGLDRIIDRRRQEGQPPMDLPSIVKLLQPAVTALSQAHKLPTADGNVAVIHRDLKPENLFVVKGPDGLTVKVLDFGIARTKSAATLHAGRATQNAAMDAFTPGYAAPEQWLPKRYGQVGPWTDVFGLALTMVEALIGHPPIDGDLTAMMGTTNDPTRRPTPRTEGAKVSDAVEAAFARALAVDPRERTQSIDAFWQELGVALGASAGPPSDSRLARTQPAPPPLPAKRPPTPPRPPSGPQSVPSSDIRPPGGRLPSGPQSAPGSGPIRPPGGQEPHVSPTALTIEAPREAAPPARVRPSPPRPPQPPPEPAPAPAPARKVSFELAAPVRTGPHRPTLASGDHERRRMAGMGSALRLPIQLVIGAVALSAVDWIYTRQTGELLHFGAVRPLWVAGPLALAGVALALWRIIAAL